MGIIVLTRRNKPFLYHLIQFNTFRQVSHTGFRSWFSKSRTSGDVSPRNVVASLKFNKLLLSLLFFPIVLLAIAINLAIIVLLLFGLLLTIPVAVLVFLYNLKRYAGIGFQIYTWVLCLKINDFEND